MIKTKLPVVVLRNLVLLPHGEIKIELSGDTDKEIINNSIDNHDSYIILVSALVNLINENINISELPNMGIIGKITSSFELPNNHLRITITGVNRANIFNYIEKEKGILDAVLGPSYIEDEDSHEKEANLRMLKREFGTYISISQNISNTLIIKMNDETSLDKLTDIISNILPISYEKKNKFIYETSSIKRANILIKYIEEEKNISYIERKLTERVNKELDKSGKEFVLREKLKAIKEELGLDDDKDEINELKEKIDSLNAPEQIINKLNKELKKYESMSAMSPEYSIIKNYIDTVLSLPFGIYTKDREKLDAIQKSLDETHYGLSDAKERILEYIAVKTLTSNIKSPIICLVGPPGVGKTSLAYSIAKALNRNFVKTSVGGVSDEAEIIGHRRTYIGAKPGRIIECMIKAKSSNPVFLIDEIDKMTKGINGDPESCLLEVLDQEQNNTFTDNYIDEAFDLSKVMFILTANSLSDIPYALRDRLEIINLSSYTIFEKEDIVKNYMFSKLLKQHGLNKNNLLIDDQTIRFIIKNYTKEAGVRELERVLSSIMRKVAKQIITNPKKKKFVLTFEDVINYLGNIKYMEHKNDKINNPGVVNGLAYTTFGGSILPIEVTHYKGKGSINMTGSLGEVMKESSRIAIGYVKANYKEFSLDIKKLNEEDIHINGIHTSIPKDGPSAGVTLVSAIISSFLEKKVDNNVGMTGEITLNGDILPIGGLREKVIAAYNADIKKLFIPKDNEADINDIPKEIIDSFEIIFVSNYKEIFNNLFN